MLEATFESPPTMPGAPPRSRRFRDGAPHLAARPQAAATPPSRGRFWDLIVFLPIRWVLVLSFLEPFILARRVPIEAATKLSDEFDKWVRRPKAEIFQDRVGQPALFPTKISDAVKPMTIGVAVSEFILPTWTHPTSPPEAPELWAYWIWTQASQVRLDVPRRLAFRMWAMNLSVRCSLHTALTHFGNRVPRPNLRSD